MCIGEAVFMCVVELSSVYEGACVCACMQGEPVYVYRRACVCVGGACEYKGGFVGSLYMCIGERARACGCVGEPVYV